jgi:hypothetical protein
LKASHNRYTFLKLILINIHIPYSTPLVHLSKIKLTDLDVCGPFNNVTIVDRTRRVSGEDLFVSNKSLRTGDPASVSWK